MKYNLSLGAIFKNEAPYFKEWIEHYLARGVEHFYLINDGSTDNYLEILEPYVKLRLITIFDVKTKLLFLNRQYVIYNEFFNSIRDQTKWLIVCDLDEYIWTPLYLNFKEPISLMEKENISVYCPLSMLFGSNGYINQPNNIVNSFTRRQPMNEKTINFIKKYIQMKYICLTSEIVEFGIHMPEVKRDNNIRKLLIAPPYSGQFGEYMEPTEENLNKGLFRLNHYRLQSKEKWLKNIEKTDVNCFSPPDACWFSPSLSYEIKKLKFLTDNYRTLKLFEEANKEQNLVEDFGLINQNNLAKSLYN